MLDIEFLPHAKFDDVLGALQQAESEVGNVRGGGPNSTYVENYFRAGEAIERGLSNVFPIDVVDRLVRTADFWALREAPAGHAMTVQATSLACDRDRRRYHELWEAIRLDGMRFRKPAAFLVVPDTNMFVEHERPFDTIDWSVVFNAQIIRIIVPIAVIHELDRLKRVGNNTTSADARRALRWLRETLPIVPGAKSPNLTAHSPICTTVIEVDVDQGPTRRADADGDIIAMTRYLSLISDNPTKLVTRDLGMQIRALAAGVDALHLEETAAVPT